MAMQGFARENRLGVCAPLSIGHSDRENWNAYQKVAEHSKKLVEEYELTVDMVLVPSIKNMADRLTKVPQRWFTAMKMENGPKPLIGAIHVDKLNADQIMAIHRSSGHLGKNLPSDTKSSRQEHMRNASP